MTDDKIETSNVSSIKPSMVAPTIAPLTAKERIRAFEDEHFGADAVRINGEIERGIGSPFAAMRDAQRKYYAALERLVATEKAVADATATVAAAEAEHEAALAALSNASV